MTQQELADNVGVSRQTVNAIETGKYSPTLEFAFRVAVAFDAQLEDVFQDEPDEEESSMPAINHEPNKPND